VGRNGAWLELAWVLMIICLLAAGCGTSSPGQGSLEVRIRDHREAIEDFRELWVTFSGIGVHPAGQPRTEGWIEFVPSVQKLDLTQYIHGREEVIAQTAVETGVYNAVRLTVDQATGALIAGQPVEVAVNFETVALDFRVRDNQTTVLEFDLTVLDVSDHSSRGYELHLRKATISRDE
jgi:hypothetical protein